MKKLYLILTFIILIALFIFAVKPFSVYEGPTINYKHEGTLNSDKVLIPVQPLTSGEYDILIVAFPKNVCNSEDNNYLHYDGSNSACFPVNVVFGGKNAKMYVGDTFKYNDFVSVTFKGLKADFKGDKLDAGYYSDWEVFFDKDAVTAEVLDDNFNVKFDTDYGFTTRIMNNIFFFDGKIEQASSNKLFYLNTKYYINEYAFPNGGFLLQQALKTDERGKVKIDILPSIHTNHGDVSFAPITRYYNIYVTEDEKKEDINIAVVDNEIVKSKSLFGLFIMKVKAYFSQFFSGFS